MATLAGKIIVVVGGTSGIGFSVAKTALVSQAAHVVVASSNAARVQDTLKRLEDVISKDGLPGNVSGKTIDLTNVENVKEFFTNIDKFDHLVWTAATPPGPLEDGSEAALRTMTIRFWAPAAAAHACKDKILPGGSITFTIGSTVFKPLPSWTLLTAICGGVDALTRALAIDLSPIRVNVVSPGFIETELWDTAGWTEEQRKKVAEDHAKKLPVKLVAGPDDVAEAYLYLMKCIFVTGQTLNVDGGVLLV